MNKLIKTAAKIIYTSVAIFVGTAALVALATPICTLGMVTSVVVFATCVISVTGVWQQ